jgi:HTH-type transcriptional regulator, repressor for puuD
LEPVLGGAATVKCLPHPESHAQVDARYATWFNAVAYSCVYLGCTRVWVQCSFGVLILDCYLHAIPSDGKSGPGASAPSPWRLARPERARVPAVACLSRMHDTSQPQVLHQSDIVPVDRGTGVTTLPLIGKWNVTGNKVTTGITSFAPGTGIPLHTHNVEETVLILEGDAFVELDDRSYELTAGDVTWAPRGVPHRFANRGTSTMRIYWVYGGRDVTRTICATGVTVEHLSPEDLGIGSIRL